MNRGSGDIPQPPPPKKGGRKASRSAGFHPLVWQLYLDLDAVWRVAGSYSDPGPRLLEGAARWVKLTGRNQIPAGAWWTRTLRMVHAIVTLVGLPAVEADRMQRWLDAADALD